MDPLIIPSEKQAEFEVLRREFADLNTKMAALATEPVSGEFFARMDEMRERQYAVYNQIKELAELSAD